MYNTITEWRNATARMKARSIMTLVSHGHADAAEKGRINAHITELAGILAGDYDDIAPDALRPPLFGVGQQAADAGREGSIMPEIMIDPTATELRTAIAELKREIALLQSRYDAALKSGQSAARLAELWKAKYDALAKLLKIVRDGCGVG